MDTLEPRRPTRSDRALRYPSRALPMAIGLMLTLGACGGSSSSAAPSATPTPQSPAVLSVGGAYTVAVVLGENSCGSVTVATQPTTVAHTPGASAFSLTHGSNTFAGSVVAGGAFTTAPLLLNDGGSSLSVSSAGRFTTGGFTSAVTVDVRPVAPAAACRYVVQWTGTKQGSPNIIP